MQQVIMQIIERHYYKKGFFMLPFSRKSRKQKRNWITKKLLLMILKFETTKVSPHNIISTLGRVEGFMKEKQKKNYSEM